MRSKSIFDSRFFSAVKSLSRLFLALALFISSFFIFSPAQAAAQPAQVWIIQVQTTGGKNNTNQDFVELFNPTDKQINLKGYRLVKRSANSLTDSSMKVWDTNAFIPSKSFYLWANSGYTTVAVKPDATSSASLSDDNGVALRFGAANTGALVDALSWGKANNAFPNVSQINPGANLAIYRQNWYTLTSGYYIAASRPYNSLTSDFFGSGGKAVPLNPEPAPSPTPNPPAQSGNASTTAPSASPTPNPPAGAYSNPSGSNSPNSGVAKNYLILSAAALLVIIFLAYKFLFSKRK